MADEVIAVSADWAKRAYVDEAKYKAMYEASIVDPATFWNEHGKRIDWIKPYTPAAVRDVDYNGDVRIRWFHDGVLNVSANWQRVIIGLIILAAVGMDLIRRRMRSAA